VRRQDFSFDLPEELIAQSPLPERSASRLLVLDGATGGITDRTMGDLPSYLRSGDLLVFNDTRVVAARIVGSKPSGGRVEIFLERVRGGEALVQLRASKAIRAGLEITTPGGIVRVLGKEDELWRVEVPRDPATGPGDSLEVLADPAAEPSDSLKMPVDPAKGPSDLLEGSGDARAMTGDPLDFFERWGEVPLPPYIHRSADATDRERYQSIFAREKGAVAAPTASLHFDAPLVTRLESMGVGRAFVTLHVGAGTFQPLRTDDLDAHKMHAERVSVSTATWDAIRRTRAAGGRVIAVGTTVVRALESAALQVAWPQVSRATEGNTSATRELAAGARMSPGAAGMAGTTGTAGAVRDIAGSHDAADAFRDTDQPARNAPPRPTTPWSGETRLFIRPGFDFQLVDAMVTNFHLPESTLLMLVSAFAGREHVLAAYAHAVRARYRFFSYGDAMLVMPTKTRSVRALS
jgi:S-adenosylmethionine:tRNA ribosyltransferase-isomerase